MASDVKMQKIHMAVDGQGLPDVYERGQVKG